MYEQALDWGAPLDHAPAENQRHQTTEVLLVGEVLGNPFARMQRSMASNYAGSFGPEGKYFP
jgi:hypothetical protein